jgi:hypothetical protein
MLRAYHFENWETPIRESVQQLHAWRGNAKQEDREMFWRAWYQRSFPLNLWLNKTNLQKKGITMEYIKMKVCGGTDADKDRKKLHGVFQGEVATMNVKNYLDRWEYRIDHKLRRWKLDGNRHHVRNNLINNLQRLGKVVAPRVASAMWGLVWNRWCTARRFQSRASCLLGCGQGDDSIEHYIGCCVGRDVGTRLLRVDGDYQYRKLSLLGVRRYTDDNEQSCWAILAYGLYMATNHKRSRPRTHSTLEVSVQEVMQYCRQASEGHRATSKLLSSRWAA